MEHVKELQRQRAKRYYESHKHDICMKRKLTYADKKQTEKPEKKQKEPAPPDSPIFERLKSLPLNENTMKKYVADFNRVTNVIGPNFMDVVKKNTDGVIQQIRDQTFSTNTKRGMVQIILFLISQFNLFVSQQSMSDLKLFFEETKLIASEENQVKMEEEVVPTWDEYMKQVEAKFGNQSMSYLIAMLYRELTLRDDFQLKITKTVKDEDETNLVYLGNEHHIIFINSYKTVEKYGTIKHRVSVKLTKKINEFIEVRGLKEGDFLFGNVKLSPFIKQMNKMLNIHGGVNMYRHMTVTEELSKPMTPQERVALANKMKHSVFTQAKYMRNN